MSALLLDEDYHVHSTFSDDARSTVRDNVLAGENAGLSIMCLVDHVRRDTTYVPQLVETVRALRPSTMVHLLIGVEAKILNASGELDAPRDLDGVDHVLIADHQFPSNEGPLSPSEVRRRLDAGELSRSEALETLLIATARAVENTERPVVAHFLSLLPKIGLDEMDLDGALVEHVARRFRRAGALVEVNEKWGCPGALTLSILSRVGVSLVAGSDAHHCSDVGRYHKVRELADSSCALVRA